MLKITIAIDGYAASGKSSVASGVAQSLNYLYINSGMLYRALTLYFTRYPIALTNEKAVEKALAKVEIGFDKNHQYAIQELYLNGENVTQALYSPSIDDYVSQVSALPLVREKVKALQLSFAQSPGIVMEGRDIGTSILPNADLKIFMIASLATRAKRRYEALKYTHPNLCFNQVYTSLMKRDFADLNRLEAPLKQATDAIVMDTTFMDLQQAIQQILNLVWIKKYLLLKPNNQS